MLAGWCYLVTAMTASPGVSSRVVTGSRSRPGPRWAWRSSWPGPRRDTSRRDTCRERGRARRGEDLLYPGPGGEEEVALPGEAGGGEPLGQGQPAGGLQ